MAEFVDWDKMAAVPAFSADVTIAVLVTIGVLVGAATLGVPLALSKADCRCSH